MSTLAEDLDLVAQQLNGYFAARLGLKAPFAALVGDGPKLVAAVLEVQRQAPHLLADGILGPKTRRFLGHAEAHAPSDAHTPATPSHPPGAAQGYLIVGGHRVPTPFATVTFDKPWGLSFEGQDNWQVRDAPQGDKVDLCVLHWDECISSTHCFGVLLRRGLSVHLLLDADGMVYQALDLASARAWHARTHNERSVGIEIQNALVPREPHHPLHERTWIEEPAPHTGALLRHTDFTTAQKRVLVPLVAWLCQTLNIDAKLPTDAAGKVCTSLCPQPFAGICGHYHLQTDKVDPGNSLWPILAPILRSTRHIG